MKYEKLKRKTKIKNKNIIFCPRRLDRIGSTESLSSGYCSGKEIKIGKKFYFF